MQELKEQTNGLPVALFTVKKLEYFPIRKCKAKSKKYWEFCEQIQDTIGADCWALTVEREMSNPRLSQKEIIWNAYRESEMTIAEITDENLRRNAFIENIHGELLCHIHRSKVKTRVCIYMMGDELLNIITIEYDPDKKKYKCSFQSNRSD
jgi:hypothetical protein